MISLLTKIGSGFIYLFQRIGSVTLFALESIICIFTGRLYTKMIIKNIIEIGYFSLPVISMTAIFTGAVLALQSYNGFSRFSAENTIATVVVLSITRELGPVLAALMVSSRVGAAMAAEIATMRVTEQIDALKTLSTDPIKYLVTPRVIASILTLPLLVIVADIIGIMGGFLVAVYKLGFNESLYLQNSFKYLEFQDVFSGIVKAFIFGLIISICSCYSGFYSDKGAKGVGKATTNAVVFSSMFILFFNYLTTSIFFIK